MTKFINITKSGIIAFALSFLLMFIAAGLSHAEDSVQKFNITFPIAALGNCQNITECKAYCELKDHHDACMNFAKEKGLSRPQEVKETEILQAAKQELGCDSKEACAKFCSQQRNSQTCGEFAKQHNLGKPIPKVNDQIQILEKAKQFLGCDSQDSCKKFCSQAENKQKCRKFSQTAFEHANQNAYFCRENPQRCTNNKSRPASGSGRLRPLPQTGVQGVAITRDLLQSIISNLTTLIPLK